MRSAFVATDSRLFLSTWTCLNPFGDGLEISPEPCLWTKAEHNPQRRSTLTLWTRVSVFELAKWWLCFEVLAAGLIHLVSRVCVSRNVSVASVSKHHILLTWFADTVMLFITAKWCWLHSFSVSQTDWAAYLNSSECCWVRSFNESNEHVHKTDLNESFRNRSVFVKNSQVTH